MPVYVTGTCHLCLLVVTDSDGSLVTDAVGPEAVCVEGTRRPSAMFLRISYVDQCSLHGFHAVMGNKKPVSENTLREDVQDGVDDDLSIDAHATGVIRRSPDAKAKLG